jgi:hypothetical protein
MASRGAIAARAGLARDRLQAAMARLSQEHDVPLPPGNAFPYRQPELKVAADTERAAAFLEKMLGDDPPEYQVAPEERPDQITEGTNAPAPEGDGPAEEPQFHGHPLSYFDGKSDEEVLAVKGIGQATLDKIREAQAERDVE